MVAKISKDWKKLAWQWLLACVAVKLLEIAFDGIAGLMMNGGWGGGDTQMFIAMLVLFRSLSGVLGGLVQRWALRRWVANLRFWVIAMGVGSAIAFLVRVGVWQLTLMPPEPGVVGSMFPPISYLPEFVLVGISGFVLGFAQWLVLRSSLFQAGWWMPISALGMGISSLVMGLMQRVLGSGGLDVSPSAANPIFWAIAAVSTIFYGLITGSFLIWSLRQKQGE